MHSIFRLTKPVVIVAALILFLSPLYSCGGGSGGSGVPELDVAEVPETYEDVVGVANTESRTVGLAMKDFAAKFNAFNADDPAAGENPILPLTDMLDAAELFSDHMDYYNRLMTAYGQHLSAETIGRSTKGIDVAKQSVDPLVMNDVANLISQGKTEAQAIQIMIEQGKDEDEVNAAINAYKIKYTQQTFSLGMTTLVGGGAGVIAGLAASTAGAPVLVVTGVGVGTGVIVGAIWSWCTSDGPAKADASAEGVCALAAVEGETVELPDGKQGVVMTLPQGGPGELCLHVEGKAPLCVSATISASGNTVLTGCFADPADGTDAAQTCAGFTTVRTGVAVAGTDCAAHVSSVTAEASVGGGATVTIHTSLPTTGCEVTYDLSGTDGYAQSGMLTTGSSGSASFYVPAGEGGVHDTVTIVAVASGATTNIGYSF